MNEIDEMRIRSQLVDVLRENRVQPLDATIILTDLSFSILSLLPVEVRDELREVLKGALDDTASFEEYAEGSGRSSRRTWKCYGNGG